MMSECIEFGRMSTAREFRGEYPEHLCPIDDDARTKTVCFTSDTPEHIIEEARDVAITEQAEAEEEPLDPEPLTDAEKRRLDFSRDGVNVPKARYLKALGGRYSVDPFDHVDLAEIDGVRDAAPILDSARKTGGTNRGGGTAQYDDEAAERERRQRRAGAEQARSEECNHAEGHCSNGDPEACEFLQEVCGLDPDEIEQIADFEDDRRADPDDPSEGEAGDLFERLDGPSKGAYARSWNGYQAAVEAIQSAVEEAMAGLDDAHDAARAINGIRAEEGADPIHFERLEKANAALLDLTRHAARTCHECHAQHGEEPDGLDHEVAATAREDIRRFVTEGGEATPVGNPDGIGPATNEPEQPPEWAAQSDITDFGDEEPGSEGDTPTPGAPEVAGMRTVADTEPAFPAERGGSSDSIQPADLSDTQIMAPALRAEAETAAEQGQDAVAERMETAADRVERYGWDSLQQGNLRLLIDALASTISAAERNNRPELAERAKEALDTIEFEKDRQAERNIAFFESAAGEPAFPTNRGASDRGTETVEDQAPRPTQFTTPDFERVKPSITRRSGPTISYPRDSQVPMFERVETVIDGDTVTVTDTETGDTYPADVDLVYRYTGEVAAGEGFFIASLRGAPEEAPPRHSWTVAAWGLGRDEWIKQATAEPDAIPMVLPQIAASAREMLSDSAPELVGMETVAEEEPPLPRDLSVEQQMFFADRDADGNPDDLLDREEQRTLGGERTDPQAQFAGVPDEPEGGAEIEEEAATEFGVDDRGSVARGSADAPETEEQTLGEATGGFDAREAGQGGFDQFEEDDSGN